MDPVAPRAQLAEQVHDRLLQAICRRQLAPGARFAQEDLSERLTVSRQPISHARQRLKQQGQVAAGGAARAERGPASTRPGPGSRPGDV